MPAERIKTGRRIGAGVLIFGISAGILLLGILAIRISGSREATLAAAGEKAAQLAGLLESGVAGIFQSAEVAVDMAMFDGHFQGAEGEAHLAEVANRLGGASGNWRYIQSLGFIDAQGRVEQGVARARNGKFQPAPKVDLSTSENFAAHRSASKASDKVYVSKMLVGFATGESLIALSKGYWAEDGQFLGMTTVAVRRDAITELFNNLLDQADGAITLYRNDGTLLVGLPDLGLEVGRAYTNSHLFETAVPQSPRGVYTTDFAPDGVPRLLAYRVSSKYPIVLALWLPIADVLADWRRTSTVNASAALFGALVIVLLAFGLSLWIRRQSVLQGDLVVSEGNFAESQRISGLGHFQRVPGERQYTWSDNMFAIHGVDRATFEPSMDRIRELFVAEDRHIIDQATRASFKRPGPGFLEGRVKRPDGEVRHMRYEWRLIGGTGSARVFGIAQDITLLRQAEAGQRDNERRLADILQCSSDYIWETDTGGVFTVFTGAGVDLFHSPLRLDGTTFYLRSDEANDLAKLEQALANRRQFRNLVVAARGAGGSYRWVRVSGNPRFDDHGVFLGYRGAGTDVTDQRRQVELLEAQRKGEALGRLASGLAHEINNLLQPILIYAAAGQSAGQSAGQVAAEVRGYFGRILKTAEQAGSIVRNVLAFARRGPPKRDDVNLLTVVRETIELAGFGDAPDLAIEIDALSLDLAVRVDRTGLSQAILNLLTNASEAMKRKGRIQIFADQVAVAAPGDLAIALKPGVYCRLKIADSGPGIAVEDLNRLFDPFFTTKPQGEGTGLGLSVVSGLVRSWDGGVTGGNDPAGGAVFTIYLPLTMVQKAAAQ